MMMTTSAMGTTMDGRRLSGADLGSVYHRLTSSWPHTHTHTHTHIDTNTQSRSTATINVRQRRKSIPAAKMSRGFDENEVVACRRRAVLPPGGDWSNCLCSGVYEAAAIRFGAPQIGIGRTLYRYAPVIVLLSQDEHVHTVSVVDQLITW